MCSSSQDESLKVEFCTLRAKTTPKAQNEYGCLIRIIRVKRFGIPHLIGCFWG